MSIGTIIMGIGFLFFLIGIGIALLTMILGVIFMESFFEDFGVRYATVLLLAAMVMLYTGAKLNDIAEARSKNEELIERG